MPTRYGKRTWTGAGILLGGEGRRLGPGPSGRAGPRGGALPTTRNDVELNIEFGDVHPDMEGTPSGCVLPGSKSVEVDTTGWGFGVGLIEATAPL